MIMATNHYSFIIMKEANIVFFFKKNEISKTKIRVFRLDEDGGCIVYHLEDSTNFFHGPNCSYHSFHYLKNGLQVV